MNTKKKKLYKMLPIRLEEETLKRWRKLAHKNETTMSKMIRDLVEAKIKEKKC